MKCNFVADGKHIGFEWHQSINHGVKSNVQVEFLLMEDGQFTDRSVVEKVSKTSYASKETCRVCSSVGTFQGDSTGFTLKLQSETEAVDVTLTPRPGHVLYNGANGLIPFGVGLSYQYSFPNMEIAGTVTIGGRIYEIKDTIAWFDRQWGTVDKIDGELMQLLRQGNPVKVYRDEC
ncbi:MAG: carotenoid 1,2-hydratase [Clostridiales bacterium]|nr:carotenoid 1,2-hydratase [Clostridiales bacterium]